MDGSGATWALVLTLDRNLLVSLLMVNLGFAAGSALLFFRQRAAVEQVFIALGVFLVVTSASIAGLHAFARTPLRDAQVIVFD